jgi:hypothetical protein
MTNRKWIVGPFVTLCVSILTMSVLVSSAFGLAEGRHYEMVSPVYKGGCGARDIEGVAPDGEGVVLFAGCVWWGAVKQLQK